MENYLNIFHYCIYRFDYKLHLLSNKINPILWIYKLPFFRRKFEEKGIYDVEKEFNKAFSNKENGLSIMVSGGVIVGVVFLLLMAIATFLLKIVNIDITLSISHFIVLVLMSIIPCYLFVFKKDKYLEYFNKYKSWSRTEIVKYGWISFCFIISVLLLFIGSLRL